MFRPGKICTLVYAIIIESEKLTKQLLVGSITSFLEGESWQNHKIHNPTDNRDVGIR